MDPSGDWPVKDELVWCEIMKDCQMLHHPMDPFVAEWQDDAGPEKLFVLANAYIGKVWRKLWTIDTWKNDLAAFTPEASRESAYCRSVLGSKRAYVQWLPFHQESQDPDVRHSYWIERYPEGVSGDPPQSLDRTAVLLGCLSGEGNGEFPLFGGQGIRVVVHVDGHQARITGVSSTLPDTAPVAADALRSQAPIEPEPQTLEAPGAAEDTAFDPTSQSETRDIRVFRLDPLSALGLAKRDDVRPSRPDSNFDPAMESQRVPVSRAAINAGFAPLENPWVRVMSSRLVDTATEGRGDQARTSDVEEDADASVGQVRMISMAQLNTANVRSNDFAAINAFWHARDFFQRLTRFGFDPGELLRFVQLPLLIDYRGQLPGAGRDGKSVNAAATWTQEPYRTAVTEPLRRGRAKVSFSIAQRQAASGAGVLGLACDPRWNWHEFGHVLLMGLLGERELRFAHSVGDALAAIVCDPDSRLAVNEDGRAANDMPWRGVTFPWVGPLRRHDRQAADGWAWNGPLDQRERFFSPLNESDKAGYWVEQILSSTLFRLYRAIGGDATRDGRPDVGARQAAAEYVVYLIVRALALLGPAEVVPAQTVKLFASALIDADIGTRAPLRSNEPCFGGMVHKVIWWTFAKQGLYSIEGSARQANPDVDIFIGVEPRHDYDFAAASAYREHPGIRVERSNTGMKSDEGGRQITVCVGNLGRTAATDVSVSLYVAALATDGAVPLWKSGGWTGLGTYRNGTVQPTAMAAAQPFATFAWSPTRPGRYALLAVATCAADRANLDEAACLPCANGCSVEHAARFDNNICLVEYDFGGS